MNCPECGGALRKDGNFLRCTSCDYVDLPIIEKQPKSKNYKERNAGRFSTLSSKSRLNPVSKKQRKKLKSYADSESAQACDEPVCAMCGAKENLTKHHPYGRSGVTELGEDCITVWIWLCTSFGNRCHDVIHENPNEAMELGWLQPEYRGQQATGPRKKPWL